MKKTFFVVLNLLCAVSVYSQEADYYVVPKPASVELSGGKDFLLKGNTKIVRGDSVSLKDAEFLRQFICQSTGIDCRIVGEAHANAVFLDIDPSISDCHDAYEIVVNKTEIHITGKSADGLFHGIQTIRKSLPTGDFNAVKMPCAVIKDRPRFEYRAMHLDVSRHFFDKKFVKKYIDLLALHNMNYFHWHLTDDQGWRVEIEKYPLLAEESSKREYTVIKRDYSTNDGIPYGEGCYYTKEDIREIVDYALDRHIQIIPEIDMPGHMLAALASYPQFGCSGGPYKVWTRWGVSDQVLCPGKDETVQFAKDVLEEIAAMFPCKYIHIGGDECPKTEWVKCPDCQARIINENITRGNAKSLEDALQGWFMNELATFLTSRGKTVIVWDELIESGTVDDNLVIMSWRGVEGGILAAKNNINAIMVPHTYLYFDYYQTDDRSQEPFSIGGRLPVEKVYSYDPLAGLPEECHRHILGVQANLWTEHVATEEHAEHMVIPRIDALSEVQWCFRENMDYDDFFRRLEASLDLYGLLGYNYAKYIFK